MSGQNRIGQACWYRVYESNSRQWGQWRGGKLRAWSMDHDETEVGPAHFPVAVIEDDQTLDMKSIPVHWVTFSAVPGKPKQME